jgi:processive 1,2-diacylglycerol beta-glucosyltransferase
MGNVLILTAGYGEGHNSAARALKSAFDEQPGTVTELVDLFALRAPRLNNLSRRGYIKLINTAPRAWSSLYQWLDRSTNSSALFRMLSSHRHLLARIIREKQPDAIVSTYPVYAWLLNRLRADGFTICPHYTVITDAITINSLWYRTPSAGWFVTDHDSAAFLRERGLPADRVHVSGFPVNLAFADRPAAWQPPEPAGPALSRSEGCATDPGLPAGSNRNPCRVLFMINSGRSAALAIARELLQHRNWSITFTAGRDVKLRGELEQLAAHAPAKSRILGWTEHIPELLMTHHVVVSKAGGATTQESINALCPMIVSQIVPGQEEGNYELMRRHDSGSLAITPQEISATLQRAFANDAALWRHWRSNLKTLAQPNAARAIATLILTQGRASRPDEPVPIPTHRNDSPDPVSKPTGPGV